MSFKKPYAPDSASTRQAERPLGDRREDGEADVVDVPQADGDSGEGSVEKPVKPVDDRAGKQKRR